jgi:hypothetical protein
MVNKKYHIQCNVKKPDGSYYYIWSPYSRYKTAKQVLNAIKDLRRNNYNWRWRIKIKL